MFSILRDGKFVRIRVWRPAAGQLPGICPINEVFCCTNHLKWVSAACAGLEQLARRGLVLVSSHKLVLAPGVLRNPNGIALLATQGVGEQIQGRAAEVARWLSSHLVEPDASAPEARRSRGGGNPSAVSVVETFATEVPACAGTTVFRVVMELR